MRNSPTQMLAAAGSRATITATSSGGVALTGAALVGGFAKPTGDR